MKTTVSFAQRRNFVATRDEICLDTCAGRCEGSRLIDVTE